MRTVSEQGESSAPIEDGAAIHYTAVPAGTPVYSVEGVEVGRVKEMLDNYREHIFDGVVFRDNGGALRFADAPEVSRTAERGVTLALSAEEAAALGPPENAGGPAGALGRLFGRRR
jgi:hypothetical protein